MARLTDKDRELHEYFTKYSIKVNQEALLLEGEGIHEHNSIRAAVKLRHSMRDEQLTYFMDRFSITLVELSAIINASHRKDKQKGSTGEREVEEYLQSLDIEYKKEYIIEELGKYRFDFYIPERNTCIEFDGEQHFRPIEYFGGEDAFILGQERDLAKTDYCEQNGIDLVRIPFYYQGRLEEYLDWRLS